MKNYLPIAILLVSSLAAQSMEYTVRTGDHNDFTRLVIDAEKDTKWSVIQREKMIIITLDDDRAIFKLSSIYERIRKNRILSVSENKNILKIALACECGHRLLPSENGMIIIDISQSYKVQSAEKLRKNKIKTTKIDMGKNEIENSDLEFGQTNSETEEGTSSKTRLENLESHTRPKYHTKTKAAGNLQTSLGKVQQDLSRSVGRAATRGILKPREFPIRLPTSQSKSHINPEIFDSSNIEVENTSGENTSTETLNLRITSSQDVEESMSSNTGSFTPVNQKCPDPNFFNVRDWGDSGDFDFEVSRRRSQLFSELDRISYENAIALAKAYIYFGFGVEARQIINLGQLETLESEYVLELAEILDAGYVEFDAKLHKYAGCDGPVALWSILSIPNLNKDDTIDIRSAIQEISALPIHLRTSLAPILGDRLLSYGDQDSAQAVLRTIERTGENLPSPTQLLKARISANAGLSDEVERHLDDAIESNSEQSAIALVDLISLKLSSASSVSEENMELLSSYMHEFRNETLGEKLLHAYIVGLILNKQYALALEMIDENSGRAELFNGEALGSILSSLAVSEGSDGEFLNFSFQNSDFLLTTSSEETKRLYFNRVSELGFSSELLTEARISKNGAFESLEKDDSNNLRTQARIAQSQGNFDDAARIYRSFGEIEIAERLEFLSENWENRVPETGGDLQSLSSITQHRMPKIDVESESLKFIEIALDESTRARSIVQDAIN